MEGCAMKRLIIILIAVAFGAMAIGFVLNLVEPDDDGVRKVAEVEVIVEEPAPISFFDLLSVAAPVIRNEKVGRYINFVARYELEGEGALENARELRPRLRDAIIRRLNKTPVPLMQDSRDLDPDRLRELFLASGRRVLGREVVKDVVVEPARATRPTVQREPEPAPAREGGHD
jgi:hypothetical protein